MKGFTLLEVLIATALFAIFASSYSIIQNQSVDSTILADEMNTGVMLAQSKMAEVEIEYLNLPPTQMKLSSEGTFKKPYDNFKWEIQVRDLDLPTQALLSLFSQSENSDDNRQPNDYENMALKLIADYIQKSVRELTLTVTWDGDSGFEKITVSTYLVDLDQEISLGI